jgi:hypothetical protein
MQVEVDSVRCLRIRQIRIAKLPCRRQCVITLVLQAALVQVVQTVGERVIMRGAVDEGEVETNERTKCNEPNRQQRYASFGIEWPNARTSLPLAF